MADERISVEEVVSLLTRRRARLPFEIGAFVALEACEKLIEQGPAVVTPGDVQVDSEGHVHVTATSGLAGSGAAAQAVARVLARLLVAAGHGVPPGLLGLVEHGPQGGDWDLTRLRDELEASLVPLNRAAARRVMARVLRDLRRGSPVTRSSAPPPPAPGPAPGGGSDVDAELDAFLGDASGEPAKRRASPEEDVPTRPMQAEVLARVREDATTREQPVDEPASGPDVEVAPAAASSARPPETGTGTGVEIDVEETSAAPDRDAPASSFDHAATAAPAPTPAPEPVPAADPHPEPPLEGPASRRMPQAPEPADLEPQEPVRGRAWLWALLFLGLIGALLAVVALVRPDVLDRLAMQGPPEETGGREARSRRAAEQNALETEHRRKFGHLALRVSPEDAQVLRFVGRGPATAEDLPVGVAQEFVAIADGRSPTRAVVPPDAEWTRPQDGAPRYELAMQTGEEPMKLEDLRLGETRLTSDMGQPSGDLGSIRVITNPPGAKVYHLIGFGPKVTAENLDTTEAHELLVYAEGHEPERVIVGPSDWKTTGDQPLAELSVELDAR